MLFTIIIWLPEFLLSLQVVFANIMLQSNITKFRSIGVRARDFYEVIVVAGEALINHHFIEVESEFVYVESEIKHKILHKNIEKRVLEAILVNTRNNRMIVLLLAIYRGIDSE